MTGSLTRRHAGPRNTVLLLARSQRAQSKAAPQRRTSEPWVKGSSRWPGFPQEALSTPMPRAAVASSKANGMKREWCPGSLVSPATLRRSGRTETLTGQASHTNSSAKGSSKEQKERGSKWRKGIEPGEDKLLRSQIAVSTADAAQRRMAFGIQNLYVRFPAANPNGRRSLVCPSGLMTYARSMTAPIRIPVM